MSIRLSAESGETLAKLQRSFRLAERPPLLRLALAIAIQHASDRLPEEPTNSKGPEIPVKVITAGNDVLLDALLVERFAVLSPPLEATDRRRAYKTLVDFGLSWLARDYAAKGSPPDYLAQLAERYVDPGESAPGCA